MALIYTWAGVGYKAILISTIVDLTRTAVFWKKAIKPF